MARKISVLISILVIFNTITCLGIWAEEKPHVIDTLSYLDSEEIELLEDQIDELTEVSDMDLVIIITDDTDGKSDVAYADDYYDYNGYGVDEYNSGLLLLIDMATRYAYISTTGRAIDVFSDARLDNMIDGITEYLSDGDYYEGAKYFLDEVYEDVGPPLTYWEKAIRNLTNPILYIVLLVLSVIITLIVGYAGKSKMTVNDRTYQDAGSFVLFNTRDDFIREHQTRVKIVENTSGGGSSTHRGSSGTSHGGRGGKF